VLFRFLLICLYYLDQDSDFSEVKTLVFLFPLLRHVRGRLFSQKTFDSLPTRRLPALSLLLFLPPSGRQIVYFQQIPLSPSERCYSFTLRAAVRGFRCSPPRISHNEVYFSDFSFRCRCPPQGKGAPVAQTFLRLSFSPSRSESEPFRPISKTFRVVFFRALPTFFCSHASSSLSPGAHFFRGGPEVTEQIDFSSSFPLAAHFAAPTFPTSRSP